MTEDQFEPSQIHAGVLSLSKSAATELRVSDGCGGIPEPLMRWDTA